MHTCTHQNLGSPLANLRSIIYYAGTSKNLQGLLQIEHHQLSLTITLQQKDRELTEIKQNYPSDGRTY